MNLNLPTIRKIIFTIFSLLIFNFVSAQNSMTGDGFGGRLWYQPTNYSVGSYSAYTICGSNNQLYGWGINAYGQLGTGDTSGTTIPKTAIGMTDVVWFSAGYVCAAIKSDSSAWAWATTKPPRTNFTIYGSGMPDTPKQVMASGVKFADAGIDAVSFVKYDGTVWSIGDNSQGAFGTGSIDTPAVTMPVQMSGINNAVRATVLGHNDWNPGDRYIGLVVLLNDGTLVQSGGYHAIQPDYLYTPTIVPGLSGKFIVDVKACANSAFALSSTGDVYVWGTDFHAIGILGLGAAVGQTYIPTKIIFPPGAGSIVAISTQNDGESALALDENGNVYGWGYGDSGMFGLNNNTSQLTPVLVFSNAKEILCGETFSYIIKADNTIWASGKTTWTYNTTWSGSIWMDLPNIQRDTFTQIHPLIPPMNLCAIKTFGVIPIKLISFDVKNNLNEVGIYWKTANEVNIKSYQLNYSYDQRTWSNINTQVSKNGTLNYYQANDIYRYGKIVYYRLSILDNDGAISYSEIKSIQLGEKPTDLFSVNSENSNIHLFFSNTLIGKQVTICVFGSDGKLLLREKKSISSTNIYLNNIIRTPGEYFIKLIINNNSFTKKMIR